MRAYTLWRRSAWQFGLAVALLPAAHASAQPASDPAISKLGEIWKSQQSEIATAYIKARLVNSGSVRPESRERVTALIESADLAHKPDNLKLLVDALLTHKFDYPRPWSTIDFWSEGLKTREDNYSNIGLTYSRVYDGTADANFDKDNRQIAIWRPGSTNLFRRTLPTFRYVPTEVLPGLRLLDRKGENLLLGRDQSQLTVVETNGFVRRLVAKHGASVSFEVLQLEPVTYSTGVVFPTVRIDTQYTNDHLTMLEILVIEQARFNEPLDRATFALAAGKGIGVFDHRGETARPRFASIKKPVTNVVEYINSRTNISVAEPAGPPPIEVRSRGAPWRIIFAVTVGVLVGAGAMFFLRRRQMAR